jgi:hypothetical protein
MYLQLFTVIAQNGRQGTEVVSLRKITSHEAEKHTISRDKKILQSITLRVTGAIHTLKKRFREKLKNILFPSYKE